MYTDEDLLALIKEGNHSAFNEIHDRYYAQMFRYAFNLIGDKETCQDILQDIFHWFWENRQIHNVRSLKAYLFTAIKYQAANHIRHGKVRELYSLKKIREGDEYFDNILEIKELKAIMISFVSSLPEKCSEIFHMSRIEMLSNKEIAQKLGISETTVAVQISRALSKFKKHLGLIRFWIFFF